MIVFLHGFTGGAASWDRVCELLDRKVPSRCLSLPGHRGGLELSEEDQFEDVAARLAGQIPAGCHLVGYSLGARLALAAAIQRANELRSLTLIGVHPGLQSEQERLQRQEADLRRATLLRTSGIEAFVHHWESEPIFATQSELSSAALEKQREIRLGHDPIQLALVLTQLGLGNMPSYWECLGSISCPVQLVVGERDSKFRRISELIQERASWSRHVVPGAGHNVVLEAPDALRKLLPA